MTGRVRQKQRTRRDLLIAARELALQGRDPTIADVADAAGVSAATAYRYFPSVAALWAALQADDTFPPPPELLGDIDASDTPARVQALVRRVGWPQVDNEVLWRNVARAALEQWFEQIDVPADQRVPVRSEARLGYIDEALRGLGDGVPPASRARLRAALALVVGIDAMIALRDSCLLSTDDAKDVMAWAASALLTAARLETTDPVDTTG